MPPPGPHWCGRSSSGSIRARCWSTKPYAMSSSRVCERCFRRQPYRRLPASASSRPGRQRVPTGWTPWATAPTPGPPRRCSPTSWSTSPSRLPRYRGCVATRWATQWFSTPPRVATSNSLRTASTDRVVTPSSSRWTRRPPPSARAGWPAGSPIRCSIRRPSPRARTGSHFLRIAIGYAPDYGTHWPRFAISTGFSPRPCGHLRCRGISGYCEARFRPCRVCAPRSGRQMNSGCSQSEKRAPRRRPRLRLRVRCLGCSGC